MDRQDKNQLLFRKVINAIYKETPRRFYVPNVHCNPILGDSVYRIAEMICYARMFFSESQYDDMSLIRAFVDREDLQRTIDVRMKKHIQKKMMTTLSEAA